MTATTYDIDLLDLGLCTQVGGDAWFPGKAEWTKSRTAKAICARCPIVTACLRDALDDPSLEGIWGGTTERERARMRAGAA